MVFRIRLILLMMVLLSSFVYADGETLIAGVNPVTQAQDNGGFGTDSVIIDDKQVFTQNASITFIEYEGGAQVSDMDVAWSCYYTNGTHFLPRVIGNRTTIKNVNGFQNFTVNLTGCLIGDKLGMYIVPGTGRTDYDYDNTQGRTKYILVNITEAGAINSSFTLLNNHQPQWGAFGFILSDTPVTDIIFANDSLGDEPTTQKEEKTPFFTFINWSTINGIILNESVGVCNLTFFNNVSRFDISNNTNFTVCNTGCDFNNFLNNYTIDETNESDTNILVEDEIELRACHEQSVSQDLLLNVSCGINSREFTVDKSLFATCNAGLTPVELNFTNCLGEENMTVTVFNNAPLSGRHRITNLTYIRVFDTHIEQSIEDDFKFNSTNQLWSLDHALTYEEHGTKTIHANCTHNSTPILSDSVSETFQILEDTPLIIFSEININGTMFNFTENGTVIEFINGSYQFETVVFDSDLISINYTVTNSTGSIIFQNTSTTSIFFNISSDVFREDNGNLHTLNITATDPSGVTSQTLTFNITDLITPDCSGFDNTTNENNTLYTWDVTCTDESFFELSVECDNGFTFNQSGLDVVSYDFSGNTLIVNDTTCTAIACDGHTAKKIDPMLITDQTSNTKRTFDNKITVTSSQVFEEFDTDYFYDRHKFKLKFTQKKSSMNFTVTSDEFIYIMDSPRSIAKYDAWLVTGNYWIDFDSKDVMSYKMSRVSNTEVFIELIFNKELNSITFNSIGQKNCNTFTHVINSTIAGAPELGDDETRVFTNIPQALFWIALTFFWFSALICSLVIRGDNNKRMGILIILQSVLSIAVGLGWVLQFNKLVGFIILFTGLGVFIGSIGSKAS